MVNDSLSINPHKHYFRILSAILDYDSQGIRIYSRFKRYNLLIADYGSAIYRLVHPILLCFNMEALHTLAKPDIFLQHNMWDRTDFESRTKTVFPFSPVSMLAPLCSARFTAYSLRRYSPISWSLFTSFSWNRPSFVGGMFNKKVEFPPTEFS